MAGLRRVGKGNYGGQGTTRTAAPLVKTLSGDRSAKHYCYGLRIQLQTLLISRKVGFLNCILKLFELLSREK